MSDKVFVDTNILVYSYDLADTRKQQIAFESLAALWQDRTGCLSTQVCNEFYVTVTRKLKPGMSEDAAWAVVKMYEAWSPVPVDCSMLHKARQTQQKYQLSWWDSLIVASAMSCGCSKILSEDLSATQEYFGIQIVNPFNM